LSIQPQDATWRYDIAKGSDFDDILHNAVADIDLDGKKEVLLVEYSDDITIQNYIYVLEPPDNGKEFDLQQKVTMGTKGGATGAIAVANINSTDDYPEVVVPGSYGIDVYRYDSVSGNLAKIWNNTHAEITETALVADVDADNNYELVYATSNYDSVDCASVSCTNKLYVVDGLTGTEECSVTLSEYPISSPAVGNLDSDKELEIAIVTRATEASSSSYGHIRTYEHDCTAKNFFPGTNDHDTQRSSADIADIDNDGSNDVIFSLKNGTIYVMDNSLSFKWVYYLGGEIIGTPALGDLDGDGVLEIVAKHVTETGASSMSLNESFTRVWDLRTFRQDKDKISSFSLQSTADATLDVVGGNNTQPKLEFIDDVYVIEGDYVDEINLSATFSDDDNDDLTIEYSSPLNETIGTWQTNSSDAGIYEIFVEVSDGNLTDSQFLTLTVFENNTFFNDTFEDGNKEENLTYTVLGNHSVNITLRDDAVIVRAAVDINGFFTETLNETFYEETPVVIEANELNNSLNSSLIVDKDWDTYYSAGSATGAIVELRDSDVPSNPDHIVFHLKLGIFGGGVGRFGIYNNDTGKYEIVTSNILPFNETSKDFYFDIYKTSPLWINNQTNFAMQTDNITKYIDWKNTRWYYRYLGEWASQRIYESEVRFEQEIIYPDTVSLDIGDDSFDYVLEGELHDNFIKQAALNNGRENETITLEVNSSTERFISLPKNAEITSAYVTVGDKDVETLSTSENEISIQEEINQKREGWIKENLKKGINYDTSYNGDGTFTQRISSSPINYLDNGEYRPINTRIVPSGSNYGVTKSIYKAFFKNLNEGIRIEDDDSYINFIPISLGTDPINIGSISAIGNKLVYEGVFGKGIDLEYEYESNRLKEKLIIQDSGSLSQFNGDYLDLDFIIDSDLDFYVNGEKWDKITTKETTENIELRFNSVTLFNLAKPSAVDSDRNLANLIYHLEEKEGGLHLIIKVPKTFLDNAVYPVIIDPTVEKEIIVSEDCYLDEAEPADGHNYNWIQVEQNTVGNKVRGLVKYDLSSIPNAQNITAAKLYMYTDLVSSGISCPGTEDSIDVYLKVEDSWSESSANWNNDNGYDTGSFLDRVCTTSSNTWYEWDIVGILGLDKPRGVYHEYYTDSGKKISFILKINDEESASRGYVELSAGDNYINVTYIPNEAPVLVGCKDDSTLMNSDGSDILVDLWDCHYDFDDTPQESTFTIESESNTALIDCSLTGERNLTCGAPTANQVGYSDIIVSVNDSVYADNDTLRISVLAPGDISMFINGTRVYRNLHSNYDEIEIGLEIENYLDICMNDSFGNCQVPINITSHDYKVNFTLNSIDIDYNLRELEFSEALQSYIDNSCTGNCSIPLTFGLESKGRLNISDLQIFYNLTEEIPPANDTHRFFIDNIFGEAVAWFGDEGNLVLNGTCTSGGICTAPADSYIIDDSSGDVVAYIDNQGNLCIETGDCSDQSASCDPSNYAFIVEDVTGTVVSYLDNTGDLCLTGRLYENSTP
ncbi:MAG: DNRLRE domain-containing protein, partial [Nanoarchaeota archaeon]